MFNTKILENLMVAFCFCITLALHLLIFNHYFSLQEGWWETYAYLVNRGEVINKDFYLAWTPLFVYINAFYQKIFGINFFAFACIGVVAAMIQVILLYLVLREFFSKVSSAVAALFATFLNINSGTYIAKDYHTYVYITEFLTLLFFIKYIKNYNSNMGRIYHIIGILFCILLFFIKQNVGLVLFASLFVAYAFVATSFKDYIKRIGFLLITSAIFFTIMNFVIPFNLSSITENDSKGSFFAMATRFITYPLNQTILKNSLIVSIAVLILYVIRSKIAEIYTNLYEKAIAKTTREFRILMLVILHIILIYCMFIKMSGSGIEIKNFISLSIGIILFLLYICFKRNDVIGNSSKIYAFMIAAMAAISYSGTLADAFTASGNMICIAFASAFIINISRLRQIKYITIYIHLIIIFFMFLATIRMPYYWNFNTQVDIFSANSKSSYAQLDGIYMDERISEIFDYFDKYVAVKSKNQKDFYFFNFPIMYLLNNKIPPYYLVTHWLDVSSSKAISREYDEFIKSPAQNVVMYQYQTFFFTVHRNFQVKSSFKQLDFHETMNQWVREGRYKFIKSFVVPYDNVPAEEEKNHILKNMLIILQNEKFFGMDRSKFTKWLQENGVTLVTIRRDKKIATDQNGTKQEDDSLQNGDVLQMDGSIVDLCKIFPILGVAPTEATFFNTINVYEKQEGHGE